MQEIQVRHDPPQTQLEELGVFGWDVWSAAESTFPWSYDAAEDCYFLKGEVVVTPDGGEPVRIAAGDLVTFPRGMSCTWEIKQAVRKHYRLR